MIKLKKKIPNHDEYVTTQEFNKLAAKHFTGKFKQANLASKNDTADSVKKTYFDETNKIYK